MPKSKTTSWGNVAEWYDELLEGRTGSYQDRVILPNIVRHLSDVKGQVVLDLACGQGFFTRAMALRGAHVIGVDIAPELITLAKQHTSPTIAYHVAPAHALPFLKNESVDVITLILALQNIENVADVLKECARVLKPRARVLMVFTHPAFRVPHGSSWEYDEAKKVQYRRTEMYMSERKAKIVMHPGDAPHEVTFTFHRPLQYYVKALCKAGLYVSGLEEWVSHKLSMPGARAKAENTARHEIPLFLYLEGCKIVV